MLEALKNIDTQWFLWVNSHHSTALDWVMWMLSQHWSWAIVIVLAFVMLTLKHEPRRWWIVLAGIVLCFLLADQGSVHLFKDTVCRLRPCHVIENVRMFRTHCGGQYGFVSSHAANAFAIATFLFLRYRRGKGGNNRRAMIGPILLLLWACATSYSRAYLGKHYPGDLICGALFGALIGVLIWLVTNMTENKVAQK